MTSRGPIQRVLLAGIALYQGVRVGKSSNCRFIPSCSTYGREAIEVHGAARGTGLLMRRLLRCRPGGGHGVDLVPPARSGTHHHAGDGV